VVTDIGGVLSHGSIVAREYGIPAVLGTGVATRRISTGDVISIDGGTGTVRLDGEPQDSSPAGHAVPAWAWVTGVAAASAGVVALVARRRRA
jgi:pyruvate,water dikinase